MGKKFNLSEVKPCEVSLVDEGAIQKKFIIFKNKNGQSEFKKGEFKSMKIEEAIELGLVDAEEAERIGKKKEEPKDNSNVIKELLGHITKMLSSKSESAKTEEKPVEKMTPEEKKAMEDKKKKEEDTAKANTDDVTKLKEQVDALTKQMTDSKKGQELLVKLSSCEDPKEFLKVLKEIKELNKKDPEPKDANERIVKVLDSLEKRLESMELVSKGLKGQESTEQKKSGWGGAFR